MSGYKTMFDLVEGLIVSSYGGAQDAEQRDIRTAIHRAYNELTTIRDWSYYHVHGRVMLQGTYNTGTVTVGQGDVYGSGTAWNTVNDLTVLPKHFTLRIGDRNYQVAEYVGSTAIRLGDDNLLADHTAEPYTLFRSIYPLPEDFRNLDEPSDEYNWWAGLYVTPDQAMKIERVSNSSGAPYHWTVIKDPHGSGWAIKIVGYPTQQETLDFTYRRTARPIRFSGHEPKSRQGTLERIGTLVSGSQTAFVAGMVGSVLRTGDTSDHPGAIESMTPWITESKIISVSGVQTLNTDVSGGIAATTKYIITDPMDVPAHMHSALDSACDYWLARIRGVKTEEAFGLYQRDLRLAMEQDQLAPLSGRSRNVWHDGGWRSPLMADVG